MELTRTRLVNQALHAYARFRWWREEELRMIRRHQDLALTQMRSMNCRQLMQFQQGLDGDASRIKENVMVGEVNAAYWRGVYGRETARVRPGTDPEGNIMSAENVAYHAVRRQLKDKIIGN